MKANKAIYTFEKLVTNVLLWSGFLLMLFQVFMRYLFHMGFAWVPEVVVLLFINFTLAAASTGVKSKTHIGVEVLVNLFPARLQKMCSVFSNFAGSVLYFFMACMSVWLVFFTKSLRQVTIILEWPLWLLICYVPVSFFFMGLHYVEELWKLFQEDTKEKTTQDIGKHL